MTNTSQQANQSEFAAFAASVRALRGQRSQREIAESAGISPSTVARAERGGEIYVGHALAIAKALGRTLDEMMQMEWEPCDRCGGSGVQRRYADDAASRLPGDPEFGVTALLVPNGAGGRVGA